MLRYPDRPHIEVLGHFVGGLYTPERHNEMRLALEAAGVTGDLDAIIAAFVNVGEDVSRITAKRAASMRSA
jgi:hypothetical protein